MRFRVLGALEVADGEITAGRDRVVLALLLLGANRAVHRSTLMAALWGERPPATMRTQVQSCISRLRRLLPAGAISTTPDGYRLHASPDELDAVRWADLRGRARAAEDPESRRELLGQALSLWRGPVLAGLENQVIRSMAAALDEQYAAVVEEWARLGLAQGPDPELIAVLNGAIERFPLRESLWALLMIALHRTGRQGEALAAHRTVRTRLRDELGVDPGAELTAVHREVLAGTPAPAAGPRPRPARPWTLPGALPDFTGRADLVRELLTGDPAGPVVRVIDGMAGIGKTSLAVYVAGELASRYPDAQLFIDLHGHGGRDTVTPAAALATLLRRLGTPAEQIPVGLDDRVALWRTELARRRTVLVLDNAASSAQIRHLLPGTGTNVTLVTSRRRLAGLDGVRPTSVPPLPLPEATEIFRRIVGRRAVDEPEATEAVLRRCGGLPLAVRLAAARLALRPGWRVADLLRRLDAAVLPELTVEERTVSAVFATSYALLTPRHQLMFRVLGVHPGERIGVAAAAALAGVGAAEADDLLGDLLDIRLVESSSHGWYHLHDLVREYATSLVAQHPEEFRTAALGLLDLTVHSAAAASWTIESPVSRDNRDFGRPLRPDLLDDDPPDPFEWFDRHGADHLALLHLARSIGATSYVWRLARAGWRLWFAHGHNEDLVEAHRHGLAAAREEGSEQAVAVMANYLASGLYRLGRMQEAADIIRDATREDRVRRSPLGATMLNNLMFLSMRLGAGDAAVATAHLTLSDPRQAWARGLAHIAYNGLGLMAAQRGAHAEALHWHRAELFAATATGSFTDRLTSLTNVAIHRMHLGHPAAERLLRLTVSLNERFRNVTSWIEALSNSAVLRRRQGRLADAIVGHERAVAAVSGQIDRRVASEAHLEYGLTLWETGARQLAADAFRRAQQAALEGGARYEQARADEALAGALAAEDPAGARRLWLHALGVYRHLGAARHEQRVREQLTLLSGPIAGR